MRVPVRQSWIIAIVVAAFLSGWVGVGHALAQAEHAAAPQATPAAASEHAAQPSASAPASEHKAAPAGEHQAAASGEHNAEGEGGEHGGSQIVPTIARLFNFSLLVGTLFYLLRSPLAVYLAGRSTSIRERLVKASDMRATAAADQAAIAEKMKTLPAELDALRAAGALEIAAEEVRVRQAADAERARLLDVTRRDIDTQLKVAARDLMKRAAELAVSVATERVKSTITDADQIRLVDRYLVDVAR
jgi:F0F1-type ATP synthase membrane subunit b/b'